MTQARSHPQALAYLERRVAAGDSRTEAIRALKRRVSDVVYRALLTDAAAGPGRGELAALDAVDLTLDGVVGVAAAA